MKRGQKIGPYVVHERIGKGAMGEVWLAQHTELGHRYALKILGRHLLEDKTALARFEVEMEGLARVDGHPGIVRVHSAGRTREGLPWIAMEYVPGKQLSAALKGGLSREEGYKVVLQVARALGHAHARGLVHRDVKPDNVLLGKDGAARLTDFGLAKLLDRDRQLTRSHDLVGTPFYLAPEQANQTMGEVGPWSDVYSLGAVLYEVLVGEPPHMGTTTVEVCTKVVQDPIVPPSLRKDGVPPAVEAVCLKALIRDPRARYRDGKDMAEALEQALLTLAPPPPSDSDAMAAAAAAAAAAPQRTEKERLARRRLAVRLGAGAAVLAALVGGGALLLGHLREGSRRSGVEARARETAAAAAAVERRLRGSGGPGAGGGAALEELTALLGALPQDELPDVEAARAAVQRALEVARGAAAAEAWARGDVAAGRIALGSFPAAGPPDPARAWILLLSGEPAAALELNPPLPPAARAWAAAWAGQVDACRQALAGLPSAERAQVLSAELVELLPGLRASPAGPQALDVGWAPLAAAAAALGEGRPGLAVALLPAAAPPGETGEQAAARRLLEARLLLSRGELAAAGEAAAAAAKEAASASPPLPLEQARALLLSSALDAGERGSAARASLARLAPGLPGVRRSEGRARLAAAWEQGQQPDLEAVLGPPLSPLDRARAAARQGDRAGAQRQLLELLAEARALQGEPSFLELERRACASGRDGPEGVLLARAAGLARLALQGRSWRGAEAALRLSAPLLRLRPESPGLWLLRAQAARVLHRPAEALVAAERALRLSPADPQALLERARALLAAQVHGLPAGGPAEAARLRADLARARGGSDSGQDLAAAEALAPALSAFRAARDAAAGLAEALPSHGLERRARLGVCEVLLERARRRVLGGGIPRGETPVELAELESELRPLLAAVRVVELARARARLGAALLAGEPRAVEAAEDALIEARPALRGEALEAALLALRLRALSGLPGAEAHAEASLALGADLPARALWRLEVACTGAGDEAAVGRALRLAPTLPAAALADDYLQAIGHVDEAERCRRLARLASETPSLAGFVLLLAGLAVPDAEAPLPSGLEGDDPHSCLARAFAAHARRTGLTLRRMGEGGSPGADMARRVVLELERALQLDPTLAAAHQALGMALGDLARPDLGAREREGPPDPRFLAEGLLALEAAGAGLEWGLGPPLAALSLVSSEELRAAAAELFLRGGGELLRSMDARVLTVRSMTRRRELGEALGRLPGEGPPDRDDPRALLAGAAELDDPRRGLPALALTYRLRAGAVRLEVEAGLPPIPGGLSPRLRERLLGPEPLDAAAAKAGGAALEPWQAAALQLVPAAEPGPDGAEAALRALWLSVPAGELAWPVDTQAQGRPLALPAQAPEMHHSLLQRLQADGALWEVGRALRSQGAALARLRELAPGAVPPPEAPPGLAPWSALEAQLLEPQDAAAWRAVLARRAAPPAEELRLLLDRAAAFERARPLPLAAARLGQMTRALALDPGRARERTRLLQAGLSLARAARAAAAAPPPAPLSRALADLALDLTPLEGAPEAALRAARDDAEAAARGDAPPPAPGEPAVWLWSLARARALAGDDPGAEAALAQAARALEQDPVSLLPFRAWVARDPWLARLRARPRLAAFLGTWVPE